MSKDVPLLVGEVIRYTRECRDYAVSNVGRVFTYKSGHRRILKSSRVRGYWRVTLYYNGRGVFRSVHGLMLSAFRIKSKEASIGRHLDDNKDNNVLPNLAYGTCADNTADAIRNKRFSGVRKGGFTDEQAREIFLSLLPASAWAKKMGTSRRTIEHIRSRARYKHATEDLVPPVRMHVGQKITREQKQEIQYAPGLYQDIAEKYGVKPSYVSRIKQKGQAMRVTKRKVIEDKLIHLAPATPREFKCPECRVEGCPRQPLKFLRSLPEQWGTVVTWHDVYRCQRCKEKFVSTNGRAPEIAATWV